MTNFNVYVKSYLIWYTFKNGYSKVYIFLRTNFAKDVELQGKGGGVILQNSGHIFVVSSYRILNCMYLAKRKAITEKTQRDRRRGESQKVERLETSILKMSTKEHSVCINESIHCLRK
jgi:hypothetical protein